MDTMRGNLVRRSTYLLSFSMESTLTWYWPCRPGRQIFKYLREPFWRHCEVTRWRHRVSPGRSAHFASPWCYSISKLRSRREAALLFPQVVMTSEQEGSRSSHPMIIPNTKRHPNNTKTDQLPIFGVITGLPRPYHNTTPPWWAAYADMWEIRRNPVSTRNMSRRWGSSKPTPTPLNDCVGYDARKNAKKRNWRKTQAL